MATFATQIKTSYPIPTYRYRVTVGDEQMVFNAVSGLELSFDTIEYKDGTGGVFRMPGQPTVIDVSLKRGIVVGKTKLYDWISSIQLNQVEKKDISISLTTETGSELVVTWSLSNAFPIKLTAPSFDASSNEIAIEELSLKADSITIKYH